MSDSPFFITGTQRSGTTLLFQILNSHPRLSVLNEFWDVYPYLAGSKADSTTVAGLVAGRLGLELPAVERLLVDTAGPFEGLALAMHARAELAGKRRWGLKDPHLTYHLDSFREHYQGARFIILIRDARGVVNSYLSRRWNVANVYYGALLWKKEIALQMAFAQRQPEAVLIVRFEELLAEPEKWIQTTCNFLDEEFDEDLLDFHRAPVGINLHKGNINITKPIQKKMAEKWQSHLSSKQTAVIESIAGDVLSDLGYPLIGQAAKVTPLHRLGYTVHQFIMTNLWWQQRTAWRGLRRRLGLPVAETVNDVRASLDAEPESTDSRQDG